MNFCVDAAQLRKALADIEEAVRAHPTRADLDWGRFQSTHKLFRFVDGELVALDGKDTK